MHPMLKLIANNQHRGKPIVAKKTADNEATIYLYDMIVNTDDEAAWWGGVSPKAFIKELNSTTAETIHIRINSPGGSVFAARAMEQAIREHKSTIIAHIDGYAASAASFLIMAADQVTIAPGAFVMIHKAWTMTYGNQDDLIKEAGLLGQIDGSLVKTYAAKTGQEPGQIQSWMADETWFDAENAVALGFADSIATDETANNTEAVAWNLSAYTHPPRAADLTEPPPTKETTPPEDVAPDNSVDRDALHRAALLALIPA